MDENTPTDRNVAADELRAFIERIERLDEEKKEIGGDIKEVYSEAKGRGYSTKVIRRIVAMRKQDVNERHEFEAILELYCSALGMWVQDRLPLDDESLRVKRPTRSARDKGEPTIQMIDGDGKPLHPPVDLDTFKAATEIVTKGWKRKPKDADEVLRDERAKGPVLA